MHDVTRVFLIRGRSRYCTLLHSVVLVPYRSHLWVTIISSLRFRIPHRGMFGSECAHGHTRLNMWRVYGEFAYRPRVNSTILGTITLTEVL